jgi:hypothetical protein
LKEIIERNPFANEGNLLNHIGSIGLIIDMIGVSILFFIIVGIEEQIILIDPADEEERLKANF